MKISILILILILPKLIFSQEKNEFGFEFSAMKQNYEMSSFQKYLNDTTILYVPNNKKIGVENNYKGIKYSASVFFQPFRCLNFGIIGSFQSLKNKRFIDSYLFNWDTYSNDTFSMTEQYTVSAYSIGISSTIYINKLLNFDKKEGVINRVIIGLDLSVGAGVSRLNISRIEGSVSELLKVYSSKYDFRSEITLKVGYSFVKTRNFISRIGMNFGYQFYRTSTLKNSIEELIINSTSNPVNLDFSGLSVGVFLMISK